MAIDPKIKVIVRIFELLQALGCQQQTIAARMGVSKVSISKWARGLKPLPPRHEETLYTLLQEAWDAHIADIAAQAHTTLSRKEWQRYLAQEHQINEALKHHNASIHQLQEHIEPGAGLRELYVKAEALGRTIAAAMDAGPKSWTFRDRTRLRSTCEDLSRLLDLIHLVEPREKFESEWQRFFYPKTGGEETTT